jgi:hypothetical protein
MDICNFSVEGMACAAAYCVAVTFFQFAEDEGGKQSHTAEDEECAMDAVDELRRIGKVF